MPPAEMLWSPVHYHQLSTHLSFVLTLIRVAVTNIKHLKAEPVKDFANVRIVIDADHDLTFTTPHEVGHAPVVVELKINSVPSGPNRVDPCIEKCVGDRSAQHNLTKVSFRHRCRLDAAKPQIGFLQFLAG